MQDTADRPLTQQGLISPARPRRPRVWWRRILRVLGWCLAIGSPVLWVLGVLAYSGHIDAFEVSGKGVKDLPNLLLLTITGPLAIVVLWALFVFPAQMLWWVIRWAVRAVLARRRRSASPGTEG
jgi:hypothetical protein